ncbi:cysteine hydrolase family protein [Amnibacterium kyonggiense]
MIDGPHRALLVIDVQREYVDGSLPIGYPPLEQSLPNVKAAVEAAHGAGVPVVLVRHVDVADSPVFAEGSRGAELHDTVADAAHDLLMVKREVSCFAGTHLAAWLGERDVDTLAIAGFMTQHCDESTARDAADLGLSVEFLSDATGALPLTSPGGALSAREVHERTLVVLGSGFASVAPTDAWIAAVESGSALPGPNLWAATEAVRA